MNVVTETRTKKMSRIFKHVFICNARQILKNAHMTSSLSAWAEKVEMRSDDHDGEQVRWDVMTRESLCIQVFMLPNIPVKLGFAETKRDGSRHTGVTSRSEKREDKKNTRKEQGTENSRPETAAI